MSCSSFSIEEVEIKFDLNINSAIFIPGVKLISPSSGLTQSLDRGLRLVKRSVSEKAKSEFIIAPILLELESLLIDKISVFSGDDFTVDSPEETLRERELGLNGICDFLISRFPSQLIIKAPVIAIVEAKKGVLKDGWGQCIAELVAAQKFNHSRGQNIPVIYGIVTSGILWQFMKLEDRTVTVEPDEYPLQPIDRILGILHWLIEN
jgi:hypothetical protein